MVKMLFLHRLVAAAAITFLLGARADDLHLGAAGEVQGEANAAVPQAAVVAAVDASANQALADKANECLADLEKLKTSNKDLATNLKTAQEVAEAAETSMKTEAKENIKAQSALADFKKTHVDAIAAEVRLREKVEKELGIQRDAMLAIGKELEKNKVAVDGLKDELTKEIEKSLELKRAESVATAALMDKVVAYDLLVEKHAKLQEVYNDALDHLAHPMLSEYLAAQGKELGEMRPELQAALAKAKEVMALPQNVLEKIDRGKKAILQGHENLRNGVANYVGDKHAQSVSVGLIVFLMLPPIYLVYRFVQSVQRSLQAHHFVLVLNFLAMCYFGVIAGSSLVYGEDVFQNLQKHSPATYAILQFGTLGFFGAQLWWSSVFALVLVDTRLKYAQLAHVVASVGVIIHYYEHVWSRAMLDQEHQVHESLFFVYAMVYLTGLVPALFSSSKNTNSVHASVAASGSLFDATDGFKRS
ncbi:Aste57867_23986 [Aphanomyces stellatus]|uniref:Aste57867_23986 protein n=1 Tax=Aphanomyces stellatus TaxID=120398 RepID=A0A485LQB6_9STRA|nr:hypothetical protein As57867_023913 [Aphanomyces stellatus]VFU00629.1 Aste57867_23986 [Aphanomyces stellatus]